MSKSLQTLFTELTVATNNAGTQVVTFAPKEFESQYKDASESLKSFQHRVSQFMRTNLWLVCFGDYATVFVFDDNFAPIPPPHFLTKTFLGDKKNVSV